MATPTKQELDQIKSLLDEVQKRYDQLGKSNPFRNFDQKNIVNSNSAIKQLEVSLKGVNAELNNTNDEFSNTFKSLQSIVNELTRGKVATNKITNSTRTLEDVSSKILAQKNKGIKLDSKELMSMQKKADISFTNLKQQRSQIEALKEEAEYSLQVSNSKIQEIGTAKNLTSEKKKERAEALKTQSQSIKDIAENETRLGNINAILDKSSNFQDVINKGLKREILDRKAIESSIGITGGLLSSLSKVTGITGIFDIDKIKAEAEKIAEDAIDEFRQAKEYIRDEESFNVNIDNAKTSLLEISNVALLTQEEVINLQAELKSLQDQDTNFKVSLDAEFDEEAQARIKQDIVEVKELLELGTEESRKIRIGGLEGDLKNAQSGLEGLESSAREASNSMSSQFQKLGKTLSSVFDGLGNALKSPEAIFTAIIAAAGQINSQVVGLSKSLSLSSDEAQGIRLEFAQVAFAADDTFVSTKKLLEAQSEYNNILGFQGEITAKNSQTFSELNKRLGIGVESAAQLQLIAEATGKDFEKQKLEQYETVNAVSQQFGVSLNVKQVMDEVGKAGAYGLAQFQGSVTALTEGVAQAKALGLNLDQVNSIAGKLLDFESSINAELQAELLLGKNINLEKARLAALNNDQVTLMEEINREMGTYAEFLDMNRIQREAMAEAVGMTVEGLSEALLLQQYAGKTQKEITDLAGKEVADRVEMLTTQEKFADSMEKLQGMLGDIVSGPLGQFAELASAILSSTLGISTVMGVIGGVQVLKAITAFATLQKTMKGIQRAAKGTAVANAAAYAIANPVKALVGLGVAVATVAGISSLIAKGTEETADDYISPGYGKRTLSTPEGTVSFNDKDTIVAGTNLEQNTTTNNNNQPINNSVINRPTTSMVSNNQPSPQVVTPASNTMMEGELKSIKKLLENIATKEGSISMNGTKFGTVTAMNTYQLQ